MKRFALLFLIIACSFTQSRAQFDINKLMEHQWVDSVFNSLSPEQRIAQLVWVNTAANKDVASQFKVAELIKKYNLGGVIFFSGDPVKQAQLTNLYQKEAQTPLLVAMDAEWGIGMRLPGVIPFPYNMMMGASDSPEQIKAVATAMAQQMKRLGVHINLGPVADSNTQPLNPIIGMRSFGESPQEVADYAIAYMQGLQENGIIAVAKHFPGHGDTQSDSHYTLPLVPYSRDRLDTVELLPFRKLAEAGIAGIMTAHLCVPQLDPQEAIPSSLSAPIIQGVLQNEWGYKGLVITDAMNMAGAETFGAPGEIEALALKAGNDVVEFPKDIEKAIEGIQQAIERNELTWEEINHKCRRVLAAKHWAGLHQIKPINTRNLLNDLNSPQAELSKRQMIEASLTLLENQKQLIPLNRLDTLRIASLVIGNQSTVMPTPFQKMLAKYTQTTNFFLPENFSNEDLNNLKEQLADFNLVIAGFHLYESKTRHSMQVGNMQRVRPKRPYGLTAETESLLQYLGTEKNSIEVFFSSPYALSEINDFKKPQGLVLSYQADSLVQELTAQLIFGGIGASGKLPVNLAPYYSLGDGISIDKAIRLKYTIPEELGMNSTSLTSRIDSIVDDAIAQKATPGCSVLAAKDGKVFFRKTYGHHTYDQLIPVKENDLYDLASVTKITGALAAVLKLTDEGAINLDSPFSKSWPDWKKSLFHRSNKEALTWREILAHQAGLIPYLNFWTVTRKDGQLNSKWCSFQPTEKNQLEVSPGLFLSQRFKKKIYRQVRLSELKEPGKYVYSGLSFLLIPDITKRLSGEDYTDFLNKNFYHQLGAYTITYNPLKHFPINRIIPTEYDRYYRNQQVHGTVHDEAAAVLGGISGNAGLFATANDLAKLMEMYRQMGTYGNHKYLNEKTMKEFTQVQYPDNNNRRGLGFDKPLLNNQELDESRSYPCTAANPESFGHSGFTGTFVWTDPANGLTYIFLSNRVFPTREENKLGQLNVRTNILKVIYEEVKK